MSKNYDREQGIQAVIQLQAVAGINEPREEAEQAWDTMTDEQKERTMQTAASFAQGKPTREQGIEALTTMRRRAVEAGVVDDVPDTTDYGKLWDEMSDVERAAVFFIASHEPIKLQGPPLASMVRETISALLYTDAECAALGIDPEGDDLPPGGVVVEGIVNTFVFHPERLMEAAPKVKEMLTRIGCLNTNEDGKAFVSLCQEIDGTLWGQHRDMEGLVCLALGLGWAQGVFPREFWSALPAGLPIYRFDTTKEPKLNYPPDVEKLKQPKAVMFDADRRRFEVWMNIGKLSGDGSAVLLQELWERLAVKLSVAKAMTVEERVWVLTNGGVDPDARREQLVQQITRLGSDASAVF